MIHYQVHVDSVCDIVWRTVNEIHDKINYDKKSENEEECKALAEVWSEIKIKRGGASSQRVQYLLVIGW